MQDKPIVSIVVPTFNSERFLEDCLRSIREQIFSNVEVIVVDNYSTDRTRQIAERYGTRVVLCRATRSRARNVGNGLAKGKYVLSIDSDMELTLNVVSECVAKAESGVDAVIIPEFSEGEGFWAKCKALEKACYLEDELIEASRFFKKEVLEVIKGYDPELEAGEDWDLNQRIRKAGYHIGRINAIIKHLEGRLGLWETLSKKYEYGKSIKKYKRRHPKEAKQQLKPVRAAFIRNWKKLTKDPVNALGLLILKALEFGASEIGFLRVTFFGSKQKL